MPCFVAGWRPAGPVVQHGGRVRHRGIGASGRREPWEQGGHPHTPPWARVPPPCLQARDAAGAKEQCGEARVVQEAEQQRPWKPGGLREEPKSPARI